MLPRVLVPIQFHSIAILLRFEMIQDLGSQLFLVASLKYLSMILTKFSWLYHFTERKVVTLLIISSVEKYFSIVRISSVEKYLDGPYLLMSFLIFLEFVSG